MKGSRKEWKMNEQKPQLHSRETRRGSSHALWWSQSPTARRKAPLFCPGKDSAREKSRTLCLRQPSWLLFLVYKSILLPLPCGGGLHWLTMFRPPHCNSLLILNQPILLFVSGQQWNTHGSQDAPQGETTASPCPGPSSRPSGVTPQGRWLLPAELDSRGQQVHMKQLLIKRAPVLLKMTPHAGHRPCSQPCM